MFKVLLIDHDHVYSAHLFEVLHLAGYHVLQASAAKEGITSCLTNTPDIIVCEYKLPDFDSSGIMQLFKNNEKTRAIPFIFTSQKGNLIDLRQAMEIGADDFLMKPFTDAQLLRAIDARLQKKQYYKEFYLNDDISLSNGHNHHNGHHPNGHVHAFWENRKVRTFKKGQHIFFEGDPCTVVWILHEGTIKTTKMAEDGRELITGIFHQDDFIGINSLFSDDCYFETATASTDCRLSNFPRTHFEELLCRNPDIAQKTIKLLSNQVRQQEEQLMQIAYQSVRKRISEAILRLYKIHGETQIQITRIDLAALSGTAPETVSRILTDFKNEGLIERNGNELVVLGLKKLERLKN